MTAKPDISQNNELYQKFRQALLDIAHDRERITASYMTVRRQVSMRASQGQTIQRRVLNYYNKNHRESGLVPIDHPYANYVLMDGLYFNHDGTTDEINFNDPANIKYKRLFDQAWNMMTMHARAFGKTETELSVKETEDNSLTIAPSYTPGYSVDPLDPKELPLTRMVARYLRENNPDAAITIQTGRSILTARDSKTGEPVIYTSSMSPDKPDAMKWKYAYETVRIDDATKAATIRFNNITYQDYGIHGKLQSYISRIDVDALKSDPSDMDAAVTADDMETVAKEPKAAPVIMNNNPISLLDKYSRTAKTKEDADKLLMQAGLDPKRLEKKHMTEALGTILRNITNATPNRIHGTSISTRTPERDLEGMTAAFMRMETPWLTYYPLFNRTDGGYGKVPLALAAVDKKSNMVDAILRMDDPKAAPIYQEIRQEMAKKLGLDANMESKTKTVAKEENQTAREQMPETSMGNEQETTPLTNAPEEAQRRHNGTLSKLKAALTDLERGYPKQLRTAYEKAASASGKSLKDGRLQRRFLNELGKLIESPIKPMDIRGKGNIIDMKGIMLDFHGENIEIDFEKDESGDFRNAFNAAFNTMTFDARTSGRCSEICAENTGPEEMTIKASGLPGFSSDPLSQKSLITTFMLARDIRHTSPGLRIAIETDKTLLVRHNENTGDHTIYISCAHPNDSEEVQWAGAAQLCMTDGTEAPPYMDVDILRHAYDESRDANINSYISEIGFGKNGLSVITHEMETTFVPPTSGKTPKLRRTNMFAFMSEYGKSARTPLDGNNLVKSIGLEPGSFHENMLTDLKNTAKSINRTTRKSLDEIAMRNNLSLDDPKDIGGLMAAMLRKSVGGTVYYPIFDRIADYTNRSDILAIAAVDPKSCNIKGLMRTDDPDAQPVFKEIGDTLSEKLGFMSAVKIPAPNNGSRYIPESQKPDFMREENMGTDNGFGHDTYG